MIDQLEGDIELHRKIVLAAHRLASDKSTNKSVRKKRQKDYLAASQTLKTLEQRLHQQRLRASQPDISNSHNQNSRAWPNFSGCPMESPQMTRSGGGMLVAKSCPTTPRGSVPDLSLETGDTEDEDERPRPPSACSARHLSVSLMRSPNQPHGLPPHPPGRRPTLPMSKLVASLQQGINSPEDSSHSSKPRALDNPLRPAGSSPSLPIYENIGYKSSSAYKSSYRQLNFPTLIGGQNQQGATRVHRTHSEHSLQSLPSGVVIAAPQPLPDYRTAGSDAIEHDVGAYNVPRQRTSWNYRSIDQGLNRAPESVAVLEQQEKEKEKSSPSSSSSSYAMGRVRGLVRKMSASGANRQPPPPAPSATFCTNSLDRRALRNRQRSSGQLPPQGSPTSALVGHAAPTPATHFASPPVPSPKRDYSNAIANGLNSPRTTTFPVTSPHGASVETSKPFETADIARYASATTRPRSPLVLNGKSLSNGQLRPPPPPYSTRNNGAPTDPHMEALLDFYKENERRKPKTATIV
uniref:Uncharacterized protein n=1 Tax=Plectus sambesii TaxID=2011161 RepID=A0A914WSQ7_9BILA